MSGPVSNGAPGAQGNTGPAGTGSASVTEAQLNGATLAGATSITLDRNATAAFGTYRPIVVEPFTTNADLTFITAASGTTLTVSPALTNAHANNSLVFAVLNGPALIPWSWWGGKPSGSTSDAGTNVTAFNNLSASIHALTPVHATGWGIGVDPGLWYINNQLLMERDQVFAGLTAGGNRIVAASGFPFDNTGAVAMLHPQRDGSPVLYRSTNSPAARWFMRNLYLDANGLANGCGIITTPLQPDHTENVRVDNCSGLYGFNLTNCAVHDIDNLELNNCALSLDVWKAEVVKVSSLNITGPDPGISSGTMVQLTDSFSIQFDTGDLETMPTGGKIVSCLGATSSVQFSNIFTGGFTGGTPNTGDFFYFNCPNTNPYPACNYVIHNAFCNQNLNTVNMVNDVQRSVLLNTFSDTNRRLSSGWTQDSTYWFSLPGGKVKTNATLSA